MPQVIRESVFIDGPRRLTGELAYSLGRSRSLCLMVNPHPYMGGQMDNNVITRLTSVLSEAEITTLRFDYGGVGSSAGHPVNVNASMAEFWRTGQTPIDALLIEDAATCFAWLRRQAEIPIFVVGYSFGAHVASQLDLTDVCGVGLISPTIKHHNFDGPWPTDLPKLVVYGDNDFATDPATMDRWLASLPAPKIVRRISGGQHFFRGLEQDVADATLTFINTTVELRRVPA